MTADALVSSFRAKREIFVIRGQAVDVWKAQNGKPVLKETFGHCHYLYSAALLIFMRRTIPVEPLESFPHII